MIKISKALLLITSIMLLSSAALISCAPEEPEVGVDVDAPTESVEDAADSVGDSLDEATDDLEESVELD